MKTDGSFLSGYSLRPTAYSLLFSAFLLLSGCDWVNSMLNRAPKLKFAEAGEPYLKKPDFARLEHDYPLAPADLQQLTPQNIANYSQEQVDQIYARLTAGPIPDGPFDGGLFFPKNVKGDRRIAEIVGGLPGLALELKSQKLEHLGKNLWRGKVFYREDRLLRNRIEDLNLLKPIIDGDLSTIPKVEVNGREQWLLFPARLYCGQSLLDSRRESIIIDYAFTDEIDGYRERPDYLAGRNGFQIRDEIRMVRPGFYLGRAYAGKAFLLNFVLYNKEVAARQGPAFLKSGSTAEDCWGGTQERTLVAAST
jgi:hypothetical protein